MAENEQSLDAGAQTSEAPVVESNNSNTVAESVPAESQQGQTAEKMIPQSQVSRIAAREARDAAARKESEMRAFYEKQAQQPNSQMQSPGQTQNLGGVQQYSEDQIRNMIQQEAWKMSQHAIAQRMEQDWLSTMNSEKDSDPEFAKLYDAMNIEAHPDLIIWMSGMDNKASVVKEMASNPTKFTNILMLARSGSTGLAKMELEKISASIKANQEAQKHAKSIDSPLSQLKPSNISSDNGDMSVSDYRLMFKG